MMDAPSYQPTARELTWRAESRSKVANDRIAWAAKHARDNDRTAQLAELRSAQDWLRQVLADVTDAIHGLEAIRGVADMSPSELRELDGGR